MTYQELKTLTEGKSFPIAGKNEDGENVIISHCTDVIRYCGKEWDRNYFHLMTAQTNGWTRHNCIFENGHTEEFYERSCR